jgi:hypothetical protein
MRKDASGERIMPADRDMLRRLSKDELIDLLEDAAKNWLAHDGLWFLAVEQECGMETAIELDRRAWEQFTVIEAKRIMGRLGLEPGGGLPALKRALQYRLYAYLNVQETLGPSGLAASGLAAGDQAADERTIVFRMNDCRVQSARKRKGLPDFPCKPVGLVEYEYFARTIDPRIRTRCIACPPDPHPEEYWCAWEFTLAEETGGQGDKETRRQGDKETGGREDRGTRSGG